jgi:hypothetical protein
MAIESILQDRFTGYVDISTIVSIYPHALDEYKPGIYPGRFKIPMCMDEENPIIFEVKPSIHLVQLPDKPVIQMETPSFRIAEAIVRDFYSAVPEVNLASNSKPGIVCLQGQVSLGEFLTKYKTLHTDMKNQQNRWFLDLIKRTDNDWNRYQSHKVVMPMAIFAAKKLGFTAENKQWLQDAQSILEQPLCPICADVIKTAAVICQCGYILKPKEYEKAVSEGRIVDRRVA